MFKITCHRYRVRPVERRHHWYSYADTWNYIIIVDGGSFSLDRNVPEWKRCLQMVCGCQYSPAVVNDEWRRIAEHVFEYDPNVPALIDLQ